MTMRSVFILIFIANVVLAFVSLAVLPSRVAIHFGWGGIADNWAPNYINTLIFIGLNTFLFFSLYFSPRLVFKFPARWINLPNKQYWLTENNKPKAQAILASFIWEFGIALFLFLLVVELLAFQANLSQPVRLNEKLFFSALVLFLFYIAYWCVKFFRAFRISGEKKGVRRFPHLQ
jgi:uncharacterized membrane protein